MGFREEDAIPKEIVDEVHRRLEQLVHGAIKLNPDGTMLEVEARTIEATLEAVHRGKKWTVDRSVNLAVDPTLRVAPPGFGWFLGLMVRDVNDRTAIPDDVETAADFVRWIYPDATDEEVDHAAASIERMPRGQRSAIAAGAVISGMRARARNR